MRFVSCLGSGLCANQSRAQLTFLYGPTLPQSELFAEAEKGASG